MTNKGPEWQAVFGPISTSELIKGTYYHISPRVQPILPFMANDLWVSFIILRKESSS